MIFGITQVPRKNHSQYQNQTHHLGASPTPPSLYLSKPIALLSAITNVLMLSHKVTKSKSQVAIRAIPPMRLEIARRKSSTRTKPGANLGGMRQCFGVIDLHAGLRNSGILFWILSSYKPSFWDRYGMPYVTTL
jgi:hypothetical protein